MNGCVVFVRFELEAGGREKFLPLIEANARASLTEEPGCRRFDVVLPDGEADTVLLYEIYADNAAFDLHKTAPHFLAFDAESAPLVRRKEVVIGTLSDASSPVGGDTV